MEESEHTLSTTVKTNIQMEKNGLGLILIQNGPYIQIAGLVEKSAAVKDGKLQTGDILLKIGHANVLGWTLRELRQLLHRTPIGTVLQIQVYRDFRKLPVRWEAAFNNIPEIKGPEIADLSSCASEDAWTSSDDSIDVGGRNNPDEDATGGRRAVSFDDGGVGTSAGVTGAPLNNRTAPADKLCNVKAVQSLSNQPKWISKDWHIFERKTYTFTVGSDIGCDIMIHKDVEAKSDPDAAVSSLTASSPYWTMPKQCVESSESSTSSSVSDAFWLENFAYEFE
ncbi:PDZ domain-containing protein 9 [Varanus komodoensis]|uniref:PDZ domain-containing protein 9 n=1 Tax=Varanus komodoensis TaxID=61221 RepID=UPI001CF7691F|nr:PDZ domain-containing protein 9 [Varanus komodoensis]